MQLEEALLDRAKELEQARAALSQANEGAAESGEARLAEVAALQARLRLAESAIVSLKVRAANLFG